MTTRIATWNLERATRRRRPAQAAAMEGIDADVWVLTETRDEVTPGSDYSAVSSAGSAERGGSERWVTIWSRLPIIASESMSDPEWSAAAVVEARNGTPLIVCGTVLPWLGRSWRGVVARNGVAFRSAIGAQLADWVALGKAHQGARLCVAGDFNQDLCEQHYYGSKANRRSLDQALSDAGVAPIGRGLTDPVRGLSRGSHASIDHICISAELRAQALGAWPDSVTPDPRLSDHYGVWVDVA